MQKLKMNKKYWIGGAVLVFVLLVILVICSGKPRVFKSEAVGISFTYSANYLLQDREAADRHTLIIAENTKQNRDLMSGKISGTEGPASIIIDFIPDVKEEDVLVWVGENLESNFQLSNGRYEEGEIQGHRVVAYKIDGLYQADVLAMKHRGGVIMITGQYLNQEDLIRGEFMNIISTLKLE